MYEQINIFILIPFLLKMHENNQKLKFNCKNQKKKIQDELLPLLAEKTISEKKNCTFSNFFIGY